MDLGQPNGTRTMGHHTDVPQESDSGYRISTAKEGKSSLTPWSTELRRYLYATAGLVCVGLAYIGTLLPGLPTTPWILLASVCFARSSPRLQRWLLRAPLFGPLLRDWHAHRGIRRPVKIAAVFMVVAACSFSIGFAPVPIWLKGVIAGSGVIGISTILFLVPTIRRG